MVPGSWRWTRSVPVLGRQGLVSGHIAESGRAATIARAGQHPLSGLDRFIELRRHPGVRAAAVRCGKSVRTAVRRCLRPNRSTAPRRRSKRLRELSADSEEAVADRLVDRRWGAPGRHHCRRRPRPAGGHGWRQRDRCTRWPALERGLSSPSNCDPRALRSAERRPSARRAVVLSSARRTMGVPAD